MDVKQGINPPDFHHDNPLETLEQTFSTEPSPLHSRASGPALEGLLRNPIRFVPATNLTFEDEKRMVRTQRPRRTDLDPWETRDQRLCRNLTQEISSRWLEQASKSVNSRGFFNNHVMCYRNSTIQALLHTPKLVNWLTEHNRDCAKENCTISALQQLSLSYWDSSRTEGEVSAAMAQLANNLRDTATFKKWRWQRQQDANEFYLLVVNAMIECCPESEDVMQALLGHQIARTTICGLCGHQSRVLSPFDYRLGVALSGGHRLEDLLKNNTFATVTGLEYRCDKCKRRSRATQRSQLTTVPDILEIDFLRFTQLGEGRYQKNPRAVSFNQELDLTAFSETNNRVKYHLLSVVQHQGSFAAGHYRCIARGPGAGWEILDDSSVKNTRMSTAIAPESGWTPYALFYARIDPTNSAREGDGPRRESTVPYQYCKINTQPLTIGVKKPNGVLKPHGMQKPNGPSKINGVQHFHDVNKRNGVHKPNGLHKAAGLQRRVLLKGGYNQ